MVRNLHLAREANEHLKRDGDRSEIGGFHVRRSAHGFFECRLASNPGRLQSGWKFHVSVFSPDIELATDQIVGVAQKFGIQRFHFPTAALAPQFDFKSYLGAGKVFALSDCGEDWRQILPEVEKILRRKGVRRGPQPHYDKRVNCSFFISYGHYDGATGRHYVPAGVRSSFPAEQQYNPCHVADPLQNFSIDAVGVYPDMMSRLRIAARHFRDAAETVLSNRAPEVAALRSKITEGAYWVLSARAGRELEAVRPEAKERMKAGQVRDVR